MMDRLAPFPVPPLTSVPSETANAVTHGFGWGLSLIGAVALMRTVVLVGDTLTTLGYAIYAGSLVALYGASTLSHSVEDPVRKKQLQMLDQICIFLVIAGSYTPFAVSHLRTGLGWSLLAATWLLTLFGVVARIRSGPKSVPYFWFLPQALMPVLILGQILSITGLTGLVLVVTGGAAYLIGLWFFVNDHKHPYFHAVWHCCVILGSMMHFFFHYQYIAA